MQEYFSNYRRENNINESNTKEKIIGEEKEYKKVDKLLSEFLSSYNLQKCIEKKYKKISFSGGCGGGPISIKKISNNKYYVIMGAEVGILDKSVVNIYFHIIIDIKKEKVKLIKKQVVNNTLPISNFRKFLEKLFN